MISIQLENPSRVSVRSGAHRNVGSDTHQKDQSFAQVMAKSSDRTDKSDAKRHLSQTQEKAASERHPEERSDIADDMRDARIPDEESSAREDLHPAHPTAPADLSKARSQAGLDEFDLGAKPGSLDSADYGRLADPDQDAQVPGTPQKVGTRTAAKHLDPELALKQTLSPTQPRDKSQESNLRFSIGQAHLEPGMIAGHSGGDLHGQTIGQAAAATQRAAAFTPAYANDADKLRFLEQHAKAGVQGEEAKRLTPQDAGLEPIRQSAAKSQNTESVIKGLGADPGLSGLRANVYVKTKGEKPIVLHADERGVSQGRQAEPVSDTLAERLSVTADRTQQRTGARSGENHFVAGVDSGIRRNPAPTSGMNVAQAQTGLHSDGAPSGPGAFALHEMDIGPESLRPVQGSSSTIPEAQITQKPPPAPISRQIVDVASALREGQITVRLAPEELGHVKLSMTMNDATLVLNVQSERPETQDLIRRHIDQLKSELSDMGLGDVEVNFGGQDEKKNDNEAPQGAIDTDTAELHESEGERSPTVGRSGIDLRL